MNSWSELPGSLACLFIHTYHTMLPLSLICNPCLSNILLPSEKTLFFTTHDKDYYTLYHDHNNLSICLLCNPKLLQLPSLQESLQSSDRIVCLPVVGKEFCSSSLTILTVRKKPLVFSGGGFTVTESSSGQIVFRVEGRGPSSKNRLVLMDSLGKPLLTLHRKGFAAWNHWWGFSGEKCDGQKPIFSVKKPLMFSKSGDMEVFLVSNTRKKRADYTVQGSYKERYCKIYNGSTTIVAEVKRKFATSDIMLSRDVFSVVVKKGIDQAFIMGLVVILHQISGENDEFCL